MGERREFAEDLWVVEGPNVRDFGIVFTTRMAIVKLSDGSQWVDSPVPVTSDTLKPVTALGPNSIPRRRKSEARLAAARVAFAIPCSAVVGSETLATHIEKGESQVDWNP